jgi:signal transduction histidine kinase
MDLLDLTKIKFEKKTDKFQLLKLKDVAQYAIEAILPYAIQKDIKFSLTDDEEVTINADPDDLEIIFNNLISNAVKYNKEGGSVDINMKSENEKIIICIKDSGIGLNNEEKDQLFNEFYRVKNEQTRNISGSGLGLPIVKRVVDLYNGDIHIESEPGKGSTFTVELPR